MSSFLIRRWSVRGLQAMCLGLFIWSPSTVHAASYYVDTVQGSDAFDGAKATPDGSGQSGPWKSLARVSAASLQPGDQVLLRCGQSWRETLTLMRSGTAAAPLVVGSNPVGCANKPAIDGSIRVPAASWEAHQGPIYKVRLPLSVLTGGELAGSAAGWRIHSPRGDARMVGTTTCPAAVSGCAQVTPGSESALAISPSFSIVAGQAYKVQLQVWAPIRTRYGVGVRRFNAPYNSQSQYIPRSGNSTWQTVSFIFTAANTIDDARVDIDLPGRGDKSYLRALKVEPQLVATVAVTDAVGTGTTLVAAHHPNAGHDSTRPDSVYLTAGVSNYTRGVDGRYRSTYVQTGADLQLPAGGIVTPGLGISIRSQTWSVKNHTISSLSGSRLYISPQSEYPLIYSGWGYFLTGARWMLDSPGEWFYDHAEGMFYVWMPDGKAPLGRVALTMLPQAVVIGSPNSGIFPQHVTLRNLAIRNVSEGVRMSRTSNVSIEASEFSDISSFGIFADGASFMRVQDSVFRNTGSDAIHASTAPDASIIGNTITNSGVVVDGNGRPLTLPSESYHAIQVGARATITSNVLTNLAYNGILLGDNTVASFNVVRNFSLMLNDSGGFYAGGSQGAVMRNNVVLNGVGNRDGTPSVINTLVSSVYLDGNTGGYTLAGNTFGYADHCVQLHDAFDSILENNTCYGARRNALRLQETNRNRSASGDTYGNVIRNNRLFQSATGAALLQSSRVADVADFATFEGNAYSTLISPVVSYENSPGISRSFTLPEWQALARTNGRVVESTGYVGAPLRRYARGLLGGTLLSPELAVSGWSRVGSGTPSPAVTTSASCGPSGSACVSFDSGGGNATMVSPRFPLIKERIYRVSFDARVSDPVQLLKVGVLRAGPTYESLMGLEPFIYSAGTTWRRYGFTFKASADSVSARMDFNDIAAGRQVQVANFEVVPFADTGVTSTSTLLANTARVPTAFSCPVQVTQPQACGRYFSFPDGARISWPLTVAVGQSKIVFSQDDSLPDADGDGVADIQDRCPGSSSLLDVDSQGCAIDQTFTPAPTTGAPPR